MSRRLIGMSLALVLLGGTASATAADAEAGKAKVQQICSECHEAADWKGKSEADLQAKISSVVAGKVKHPKKLQLSDAEIANVAAYWASAAAAK
jgi:mono/diheme cytochrome c family protein